MPDHDVGPSTHRLAAWRSATVRRGPPAAAAARLIDAGCATDQARRLSAARRRQPARPARMPLPGPLTKSNGNGPNPAGTARSLQVISCPGTRRPRKQQPRSNDRHRGRVGRCVVKPPGCRLADHCADGIWLAEGVTSMALGGCGSACGWDFGGNSAVRAGWAADWSWRLTEGASRQSVVCRSVGAGGRGCRVVGSGR